MTSFVSRVVQTLQRIAPLSLAESWDNVGLLIESPTLRGRRVLLTTDLTPQVVEEAISHPDTGMIISYHPPIFKPLSSLTLSNPLQRTLLRCAAMGISVYSPHTAVDAMKGGVNDWLAGAVLGEHFTPESEALTSTTMLAQLASNKAGVTLPLNTENPEAGGRLVKLSGGTSLSFETLVNRVKAHLGLKNVQVAYPDPSRLQSRGHNNAITSVALCAGSGASVLANVKADVYFTGEMQHHDILAAVASGKYVILCGHTNTERGYLPILRNTLSQELSRIGDPELAGLSVGVSVEDAHPLQIV